MKLIYLFLIIILVSSCNADSKGKDINSKNTKFRRVTPLINDSLKTHFYLFDIEGVQIACSAISNEYLEYSLLQLGLDKHIDLDSVKNKQLLKTLLNQAIATYSNKDSLSFDIIATIPNMPTIYKLAEKNDMEYPTEKVKSILSTFGNKIIIPYFKISSFDEDSILGDKKTITGLKDNCTIHILKYGLQNVMPAEWTIKNDWLPEKVRHGYITGLITQEGSSIIRLWTCVW